MQQVSHYEVLLNELNRLYDASGDVIPFKDYMRLIVAVKVLVGFYCFMLFCYCVAGAVECICCSCWTLSV